MVLFHEGFQVCPQIVEVLAMTWFGPIRLSTSSSQIHFLGEDYGQHNISHYFRSVLRPDPL
jgi:hypothetical protein